MSLPCGRCAFKNCWGKNRSPSPLAWVYGVAGPNTGCKAFSIAWLCMVVFSEGEHKRLWRPTSISTMRKLVNRPRQRRVKSRGAGRSENGGPGNQIWTLNVFLMMAGSPSRWIIPKNFSAAFLRKVHHGISMVRFCIMWPATCGGGDAGGSLLIHCSTEKVLFL